MESKPMKYITTSWDDGHMSDFRVAELLEKYNIKGTFYIPLRNKEHDVMEEKKVSELAKRFEVGGHTINHVRINKVSDSLFEQEIKGCYTWLTDLLGDKPVSFCFPGGVYNTKAYEYAKDTGYKIIRTTELLDPNWNNAPLVHTTLQVYPHSRFTYYKHLLKYMNYDSFQLFRKSNSADLMHLVDFYLDHIEQHGGCFHLWGHSWELDEYNLWNLLESILQRISNLPGFTYIENKELVSK